MPAAKNTNDVDEPVQDLPVSAETATPSVSRGHGERCHHDDRTEPDRDKRSFEDILDDRGDVEKLVEYQVVQEMQPAVCKREKTEHSPELRQPNLAGRPA